MPPTALPPAPPRPAPPARRQAVEATGHISRANVQLGKAIRANRSSRKFLLVFFLAASLGVLFLDWWYS